MTGMSASWLVAVALAAVRPTAPVPEAGVSLALARQRAARVSELRYGLSFDIPMAREEPIRGRAALRFVLSGADLPLALDFAPGVSPRLTLIVLNGTPVPTEAPNGHPLLPAGGLRAGENVVEIEFLAGDAPLNRSDDFLYTLFVPARGSLAFPCFDQPDLKARWSLSLEIPAAWRAVANGAESERQVAGDRARLRFAETPPLPTYLFAFAAGRFEMEEAERGGRRFRMLHRETDPARVARNRDAIFDLHAAALEWLERYTGIPYPFGKFDFVLVPSFQFGGMEHAGAIFYNASGLLLDESATQNQKLGRASLIAHETAHMWFGDLVTMRWFDDVWMKEVFANFMAAKIVNPSFPEINHDLRFLLAHYPAAYEVDRTLGTNAIRQPLGNLNEAGTLYGAIIYQKAPIVMRQLELIVGEEPFRARLREYLARHALANASWPDLITILDARTDEDLAAWSRVWVEEEARPVVRTRLEVAGGRITRLALEQSDPRPGRGLSWTQRLHVTLGYEDGARTIPVTLRGARVVVGEAAGLPAPKYVLPAGGGLGYGLFHLDPASLAFLVRDLPAVPDPLTRGAAWVTLWDAMLEREIAPPVLVDLALAALPLESDEQNTQRILGYLARAYWRFLSPAARAAASPRIERALSEGLERASTPSLKSAYFSALREVAASPQTVARLERVWRRDEKIPGLVLSEADEIELALEIAVREGPSGNEVLHGQHQRTKDPDRKARLAFVMRALSSDPAAREAFFASLLEVENRRREAWVLEALRYLHHPLRAAHSERFVPPSLGLLLEIQRTGDIFFPKRWLDATLRGHQSSSAAQTVNRFLAALPPDYPPRLRKVILSSADELLRIDAIVNGQ